MSEPCQPLLEVKNLKKYYPLQQGMFGDGSGTVKAVDGISFYVEKGETLGLVGESGSGKTTTGRAILRAIEPTEGEVLFRLDERRVTDLTALKKNDLRQFRQHVQMIFQDPYSSLNPRMTGRDIIAEPLVASGLAKGSEVDDRVRQVALRASSM